MSDPACHPERERGTWGTGRLEARGPRPQVLRLTLGMTGPGYHPPMRRLLAALTLFAAGCATQFSQPATRFKILQINDVYKIEGLESGNTGGLARVRTLRKHLESDGTPVIVLHGGDALYPSVMSKYLDARPMVDVLNLLDGNPAKEDTHLVVTFGNHEFDNQDPKILLDRLKESQFQWVSTNVSWCTRSPRGPKPTTPTLPATR